MVNSLSVPPKLPLPVSKGGDLIVDFMQKVDDVYTDYDFGVTVKLEVDIQGTGKPAPPVQTVTGLGDITAHHAVCRIESEVADLIKDGSLWRCIVSYPTVPSTDVIAVNGRIIRADGA